MTFLHRSTTVSEMCDFFHYCSCCIFSISSSIQFNPLYSYSSLKAEKRCEKIGKKTYTPFFDLPNIMSILELIEKRIKLIRCYANFATPHPEISMED
jgi:hypothetical protein